MLKSITMPQIAGAAVMGTVTAWLGIYWVPLVLIVAFLIMDYVTGFMAACKTCELSSSEATKGLLKKAGFIILTAMGFLLDFAVHWFTAHGLHYELPFNLPFGMVICAWVILTEAVSITENLYKLGVHVPKIFLRFLKIAQEKTGGNANETTKNEKQ
jgi:toxin secretion/phage lysis holin